MGDNGVEVDVIFAAIEANSGSSSGPVSSSSSSKSTILDVGMIGF